MIITDELYAQIMAIRESGLVNMFDINGVQIEASKREFYALVVLIEDYPKAYLNFVLTGVRECGDRS